LAFFDGLFNPIQYEKEQLRVQKLLSAYRTLPGKKQLLEFLEDLEISPSPNQKE